MNPFLQDLVHTDDAWPAWMDTVGLDEGDAEDVNGELVATTNLILFHFFHGLNSLQVHVAGAQIPVDIAKVWS